MKHHITSAVDLSSEALDTAMENLKQQKHYKFNQLKTKKYMKNQVELKKKRFFK